jgi:Amt family ammonium transporter
MPDLGEYSTGENIREYIGEQKMSDSILSAVSDSVLGVWFLIGAALVFFMQCGFAMVESGFTRAKNAGNIIMKNLMDFCIGAVMFILLGFGLMMGEECLGGLIGMPTLGVFTDYAHFDWSNFVFNLVFCATAATIVSGAMAERTKFSAYCIYSAVISAVVYPVEAGWIWNSEVPPSAQYGAARTMCASAATGRSPSVKLPS